MSIPKLNRSGDAGIAALRREIVRPRSKAGRWLARLAVVACLFSLWRFHGEIAQWMPGTAGFEWDFHDRGAFLASLKRFSWSVLAEVASYFVLGFLIPFAVGREKSGGGNWKRACLATVLGLVVSFVACTIMLKSIPTGVQLAFPAFGSLAGLRVGRAALRGVSGLLWLIPGALTHVLLVAMGVLGLLYFASDVEPLPLDDVTVSAAEKRRLMKLIRNSAEEGIGATRRLRLAEDDVNQLTAWGLQRASVGTKIHIQLAEKTVKAEVSHGLAVPRLGPRYLNVRTAIELQVTKGHPVLQIENFRVGHLTLPRFVCANLSRPLLEALLLSEETRQLVRSLESMRIADGVLEIVANRDALKEHFLPSLQAKLGVNAGLAAATGEHVRHLLRPSNGSLQGDARFVAMLQRALSFARDRSVDGDPVRENQSAILALGILLGHYRVADISGADEVARFLRRTRRRIGRVAIRGRSDWTKHFFVSAALVVLSDESTSDAIGVLKEELDSEGGSGFSFSDLLADRAGTLFAKAASRSNAAARAMQDRLAAGGLRIDDVFPLAADLPEGISSRELQTRFGGIGGPRYRDLEREIERRLSGCRLLQ